MNNRQERIAFLSRLNRGRLQMPSFLSALSRTLGDPIDATALAPLPNSDVLLVTFRNGYQAAQSPWAYRRFFLRRDESSVFRLAACLAERLSEDVYFLTKKGANCGAVRVSVAALLKHAKAVISLDGDSVSALSLDGVEGLLIDYNPDDEQQTYEVAVWGDRWPVQALECDPR